MGEYPTAQVAFILIVSFVKFVYKFYIELIKARFYNLLTECGPA